MKKLTGQVFNSYNHHWAKIAHKKKLGNIVSQEIFNTLPFETKSISEKEFITVSLTDMVNYAIKKLTK